MCSMKQNDEYYENKKEYLEEKKIKCELCEEMFDEENGSDNPHRCNDCYEEWGESWPDQV